MSATALHDSHESHDKSIFVAVILLAFSSYGLFSYQTGNLEALGLAKEVVKNRTIEIIVLFGIKGYIAYIVGKIYKTNKMLSYILAMIWLALFIVDFAGLYQSRNAVAQQQKLTREATEKHADLIHSQIGISQGTAKELTDSAQRQRDNKLISGGAVTAQKAAKQSDNAMDLIKLHGETVKQIKPTESDTFGEWMSFFIFLAMFGWMSGNDVLFALIGELSGKKTTERAPYPPVAPPIAPPPTPNPPTPARADSGTPDVPSRADSGTPVMVARADSGTVEAPALDVESARAEVRAKAALEVARELDRMPLLPKMPWQKAASMTAAIPLVTPVPNAPTPPELPKLPQLPAVTNYSFNIAPARADSGTPDTPKAPRKRAAKPDNGTQMDTGVEGKASHRYKRIRQMVKDKKVNPSIRAVAKIEGENINHDRAKKYLWAMVEDGLLIWNEDKGRFEYRPEIDPRQMPLGGL